MRPAIRPVGTPSTRSRLHCERPLHIVAYLQFVTSDCATTGGLPDLALMSACSCTRRCGQAIALSECGRFGSLRQSGPVHRNMGHLPLSPCTWMRMSSHVTLSNVSAVQVAAALTDDADLWVSLRCDLLCGVACILYEASDQAGGYTEYTE